MKNYRDPGRWTIGDMAAAMLAGLGAALVMFLTGGDL
jgi:hypothetical protein